jgi:hypothetical protein
MQRVPSKTPSVFVCRVRTYVLINAPVARTRHTHSREHTGREGAVLRDVGRIPRRGARVGILDCVLT